MPSRPAEIVAALERGRVPVVTPLARGPLNVNADEAAAALAVGLGADADPLPHRRARRLPRGPPAPLDPRRRGGGARRPAAASTAGSSRSCSPRRAPRAAASSPRSARRRWSREHPARERRCCRRIRAAGRRSSRATASGSPTPTGAATSTSPPGSRSSALGHRHPAPLAAAHAQLDRLWHASNLYATEPAADARAAALRPLRRRAGVLLQLGRRGERGRDQVRAQGDRQAGRRSRSRARSTAARSARSRSPASRRSARAFEPLGPGAASRRRTTSPRCTRPPARTSASSCSSRCSARAASSRSSPTFARRGRATLADELGALLAFDEVQTGVGRTGTFFAWQQLGVKPQLVTLAKGLANGLPIGCLLVSDDAPTRVRRPATTARRSAATPSRAPPRAPSADRSTTSCSRPFARTASASPPASRRSQASSRCAARACSLGAVLDRPAAARRRRSPRRRPRLPRRRRGRPAPRAAARRRRGRGRPRPRRSSRRCSHEPPASARPRSCASCASGPISTQTELAEALRDAGHEVVQTTVSRDIHELGLSRCGTSDGRLVYAPPEAADRAERARRDRRRVRALGDRRRAERQPRRRHHAARLREPARAGDRPRPATRASPARSPARTPCSSSSARARPRARARRRDPGAHPPRARRERRSRRSGTILASLPVGERVGIAFSGGLDTCCALAWMREHGADPVRVHRRPRPVRRARRRRGPGAALPLRRRGRGRSSTARTRSRAKGSPRSSAARSTSRPPASATSTRRRSAAPSPGRCSCARCASTASTSGATARRTRATTSSASTATACSRTRDLRIYKPWLDEAFVSELGGRTEMSEWLATRGLPHGASVEKAYSTDANLLGATHEAKDLELLADEHEDRRADHGRRATGIRPSEIEPEIGDDRVRARPAGRDRRRRARRSGRARSRTANAIGGRHGLGMSDQIENRIIEAKSRGIYEAPGMALLHIAYERLLTRDPQRGDARALRRRRPPARPAPLRGPLVRPAGAHAARLAAALGRRAVVTGEVTIELRRGDDYTILDTRGEAVTYDPERLSMERSATAFTAGRPHRPARGADQRHRRHARACSPRTRHLQLDRSPPTRWSWRVTLWAARTGVALDPEVGAFLRADDDELLPYDCAATAAARAAAARRRASSPTTSSRRSRAGSPTIADEGADVPRRVRGRALGDRGGCSARSAARSTPAARATTRSRPRSRLYVAGRLRARRTRRSRASSQTILDVARARGRDAAAGLHAPAARAARSRSATTSSRGSEMLERDRTRFALRGRAGGAVARSARARSPARRCRCRCRRAAMRNSLDAVADRDFALDYLYAARGAVHAPLADRRGARPLDDGRVRLRAPARGRRRPARR